MSKVLSALCLLFVVVLTPATTKADPIVITSGFLTVEGFSGGPHYALVGDNLMVIGAGEKGASSPQVICSPCVPGQMLNVNGLFAGSSLGTGSIALNGMVLQDAGFSGTFTLSGAPFPVPFALNDISVTSPFTFVGHLIVCPQDCVVHMPIFSVDMIGGGTATVDLLFNTLDAQGRPLFSFKKVTYEFEVPEPVSLLLLGTGLTALAAKLRHLRRRY